MASLEAQIEHQVQSFPVPCMTYGCCGDVLANILPVLSLKHCLTALNAAISTIQEGVIADYRDNPQMELPRLMYSYELKRVRYLLQAYHRTRLSKIEKFILHILEREEVLNRLSEKEKTYAQARVSISLEHLLI